MLVMCCILLFRLAGRCAEDIFERARDRDSVRSSLHASIYFLT